MTKRAGPATIAGIVARYPLIQPNRELIKTIETITKRNQEQLRKLTESIRPLRTYLDTWAADIRRSWDFAGPLLETLRTFQVEWERSLPTNWRELSLDELRRVTELMDTTGWSLVWVPSADTLRRLLKSKTQDPARRIVRFEKRILADLDACIGELSAREIRDAREALAEAVECQAEGRYRAAQALASTTFTALIQTYFSPTLAGARKAGEGIDPEEVAFRMYRRALVLQRVSDALRQFPSSGPIPTEFNRHASVHTVSTDQLTRANSLAGLLLVASVAREVQRELEEEAGA